MRGGGISGRYFRYVLTEGSVVLFCTLFFFFLRKCRGGEEKGLFLWKVFIMRADFLEKGV